MVTHQPRVSKGANATVNAEAVFHAVADPTRRAVFDAVAGEREGASVNAIAARFTVSRPAVSKHLSILRKAGLVRERRAGRQRIYTAEPVALRAVDQWLAPYRLHWAARLMDLKDIAEHEHQRTGIAASAAERPGAQRRGTP